jgi:glycosyltransferase involved in cell wall biosynthesis
MSKVLVDVTDLVEFLERRESVSGVQRVVAETAPLLANLSSADFVVLDRARGVFVELTRTEMGGVLAQGARAQSIASREDLASAAHSILERAHTAAPVNMNSGVTLVFLGALWINDALMLAARLANSQGATIVSLLYDLTPVMEEGHTAAVNRLFERYLNLVIQSAGRVPAISESSRRDFEAYAVRAGKTAPAGSATGLPCGLTPAGRDLSSNPWPRPYALLVGTVEARKDHIVAFRAWEKLITEHGSDAVPDLVCVGRLGWHASEFLREYVHTNGLGGKVSLLSSSVSDSELASLYAHADFTVYPSRYEGWGLPVSESIAFGKVPVVARNSSLVEAGGDMAVYFETGSPQALVEAIEFNVLDNNRRKELEDRIRMASTEVITWETVAKVMAAEIAQAQWRTPVFPTVDLGREYMLSTGESTPDEGYADQYLDHLTREGRTPMLRQPRGEQEIEIVDAAVIGTFGSPQTWGYELKPGSFAEFRFARPCDEPLVLLVSTRSMPGKARIEAAGPGGPVFDDVYLGSVISLPVGEGQAGEPAQVRLSVTDASDSIEGFLGLRSFVVLREEDSQSRIAALESAADALRQELDFITGTRSWKLTEPLRKWKGRGA